MVGECRMKSDELRMKELCGLRSSVLYEVTTR